MQLNELRSEYCDREILEAIKRGENIDQRTFMFFYWIIKWFDKILQNILHYPQA